jgi:hypothetical protein
MERRTPLRVESHPAVAAMGSVGCERTTTTLSSLSHRSSAGAKGGAWLLHLGHSDVNLFGYGKGLIHLNQDNAPCSRPMPQQKLYRSQVACTAVNAVSTSSMLSYHALSVPWRRLQRMLIALLPASALAWSPKKSVMLVREPQAGVDGGEYRARKIPGCAAQTL